MKFVCDDNLGRLARWLRALGYDTAFRSDISDREVLTLALDDHRAILTRDHALAEQALARKYLIIRSNKPLRQLWEVIETFALNPRQDALFTRCAMCNEPVKSIEKGDFADEIPPYVFRTQERFFRCASCGRIFWEGTHVQHMKAQLAEIGITLEGKHNR